MIHDGCVNVLLTGYKLCLAGEEASECDVVKDQIVGAVPVFYIPNLLCQKGVLGFLAHVKS